MKFDSHGIFSASSSGRLEPEHSLRSLFFIVAGVLVFIGAAISQRIVPAGFNGLVAQFQFIVSILLILAHRRLGWFVALVINILQIVSTGIVVFMFDRSDALPGVIMPVLSILTIGIIAGDRNRLWVQNRELLDKQAALEEANTAVERAMKAKGEFLSAASHELRTPMNNIMGYLELMGHGVLPAEQREYLETITMNARNLVDLLNDILDLSKIENGHLDIAAKNFVPAETITSTLRLFEPALESRELFLHREIAPTPLASGDPMRLGQVLVNLMGNAMKFTPKGGSIRVKVETEAAQEGYRLIVSVADTGIGIPRDKQALIFEPFVQVAPSGPEPLRGTGLGLSISAQLVTQMGGSLTVDSKPGAGSTFRLSLPLAPPCCDDPSCSSCEDRSVNFAGKGFTVLIAEDTPDSLRLLSLMLKELGFSVIPSQDGAEAFTRYRERPSDLVILDGQMPGLNGMEATRKIREYEQQNGLPTAPVIILSANIDDVERIAYLESGANLSLVKPVSLVRLSHHLARLLAVPEAGSPDTALSDPGELDYLARASAQIGLPISAIEDIFRDFVCDLPDYLEAIQLSLEPLNRIDLAKASHRLRGAAATLILDEIKHLAGTLEKMAKDEPVAALATQYAGLLSKAREIDTWYRERQGIALPD